MNFFARICILALFAGLSLMPGCGAKPANTVATANTTDTDPNAPKASAEELDQLVTLPYEAEDCVWKITPDKKEITAVLHFDKVDTGKLAADVERLQAGTDVTIPTQTWYPSDLVVDSDLHGDDQLRGKAFSAAPFYKEPYNNGRVVRVQGTDYWVLQLSAK